MLLISEKDGRVFPSSWWESWIFSAKDISRWWHYRISIIITWSSLTEMWMLLNMEILCVDEMQKYFSYLSSVLKWSRFQLREEMYPCCRNKRCVLNHKWCIRLLWIFFSNSTLRLHMLQLCFGMCSSFSLHSSRFMGVLYA